ncbi:hypothetical protein CEE37_00545 [candidate division LCP-89 bacterium B3_LCP]|uniref:Gingipain domain-containing protein n=1 Tax=candidate division LCP-89 bacterium B3_LCP TaxID=2012998 RepID=A0A532V4V0_UNCL8|nr:MAG: hypothetical protein CEE37_00545 [candidate division LCP-89 bacterium B3_LCP]
MRGKQNFKAIYHVIVIIGLLLSGSSPVWGVPAPPGITLISCDRAGAVVEMQLPEYQITELDMVEGIFNDVSIFGWGRLAEEGKPMVPQAGFLLAIPPGANTSINIEEVQSQTIALDNPLPAPGWETDVFMKNHVEKHSPIASTYSTGSPFPQSWVSIGEAAWFRGYHVVPVRVTPIRAIPSSGEALVADKIRFRVNFSGGREGAYIHDPYGETTAQSSILNFTQARNWQERTPPTSTGTQDSYGDYKILVDHDGMYSITYFDLDQAGITPESIDPQTIKISVQGEEIPIWIGGNVWDGSFDPDDYILFYGTFARGTYTYEYLYQHENVYWLDWGGLNGARIADESSVPIGTEVSSFKARTRTEVDTLYEIFGDVPEEEDVDHWMWLNLDATFYPQYSHLLNLPGLVVLTNKSYDLISSFRGYTIVQDHNVTVDWNNYPAIEATWSWQDSIIVFGSVPGTYIGDGSPANPNELVFTATPGEFNSFYLDWIEIGYWRGYGAINDTLLFQKPEDFAAQTVRYRIGGLSDPANTEVWNLTTNKRIVNPDILGDTLSFANYSTDETYYFAAGPSSWMTPQIIEDVQSDWSSSSHGADYLIITHEDFYATMEEFAGHYNDAGMRAELIKVGDLYDEFTYGLKSPEAIFSLVQHAYYNYQSPAVSYVLLVGDASWDYKGNNANSYTDFVPTHSFPTYKWGETASDNWYVSVTGNDPVPDCAIGRFPVNNIDEVQVLVDKTSVYAESAPPGYWRSRIIFSNGANELSDALVFDSTVETLLDTTNFPEWYDPPRVYSLPSPGYEEFQGDSTDLMAEIDLGAAMVNYIGHAGNEMWYTLSVDNISQLENGDRLPFVVSFSCYTGIFSNTTGMGETFILKPEGGAIAYWSNGAIGFTNTNTYINQFLFSNLYSDYPSNPYTFGKATTDAKLDFWAQWLGDPHDVIRTFVLLGDPGLTYLWEDPSPADTIGNVDPEIIFYVPGSPHFSSGDYIDNPVEFGCSIYDPDGLELSSLQMELTHLVDGAGNPVDTSWQWIWEPGSSAPPDFTFELPDSLGDSLRIDYSNLLGDGEWSFDMQIADYFLNGPQTLSTTFRTAGGELVIENPLNYPNPFTNETSITFNLSQDADVTVKIYTVAGKLVRVLDVPEVVGFNIHEFDGRDHQGDPLSNGTYLYKIIANQGDKKVETVEKMVKIR